MTRFRSAARTATWLVLLAVSVVVLVRLDRGPLATPPLADGDRLRAWLAERNGIEAAFAAVRLFALAAALYLLAVTLLGVAASVTRLPSLVRLSHLTTLPAVRRVLAGATGIGLAATAGVLAAGTALPSRGGGSVAVSSEAPHDGFVLERLGADDPHGSATMRVLPDVPERPVPTPTPTPSPAAPAEPSAPWVVEAGDSMWSEAESVLTSAWGRSPTDREVVPYWRTLVEANRTRLTDPANPGLIFAGESFVLPPAPPPP